MNRIWKLFRALNKSNTGLELSSGRKNGPSMWAFLGGVIIIGLGILCCTCAEFITFLGGARMLLLLIGFVSFFLILCLGIVTLINSMYMSSDIELLITLPFSGTQIGILKVLSYFQYAFAGCAGAFLAAMIGYTISAPVSLAEWVTVILAAVLVPVTAVSLTAVLVVLIMAFLKIFRNRDTLRVIGAFLLFAVFCGYMFFSSEGHIDAQAVVTQAAGVLKFVKYAVPVVGFLTDFMETWNILDLLLSILCAAVAVGLFVLVTKKLYLSGALNMQDAGAGKVLTDADLDKYCRKKPALKALLDKEYFSVRRNPAYLMNNFIMGALWPVVVVVLFKQLIPLAREGLQNYSPAPGFPAFAFYTVLLGFGALFLVYMPVGMQTIAYSSLSREGDSFPIMKQIPVAYETQLEAKRRMAERVALISISGYSFLILIAAAILLKISVLYCILPLIIVTLYAELGVNLDMYFGILDANVVWDNEKDILKKSAVRQLPLIILWFAVLFLALLLWIGLIPVTAGLVILVIYGAGMLAVSLILRKKISVKGEKKIRSLHF